MDDLRTYLSETAQRELASLRAALDTRLMALEKALAHPDATESLEGLIIDLARVATDEAHASAARKWLEAQVSAQGHATTGGAGDGGAGIQGALIQEAATLRREVEELRARLNREGERGDGLRRETETAQSALQGERANNARLDAELTRLRAANVDLTEAVETLRGDLDSARKRLAATITQAHTSGAKEESSRAAFAALQAQYAELERTLDHERAERREQVAAAETRTAEADARAGATDAALSAATDKLRAAEADLSAVTENLRAAEADRSATAEKLHARESDLSATAEKLRALEAETATLREKLSGAEAEAFTLGDRLRAVEADSSAVSAKLDAAHAESNALSTKLDAARAESGALSAKLDAVQAESTAVAARLEAAQAESVSLSAKLDAAQADLSGATVKLDAKDADLSAVTERLSAAEAAFAAEAERSRSAQAELSALADRLRMAEADSAAARGTHESARTVFEAARQEAVEALAAATARVHELELQLFRREQASAEGQDTDVGSMLEERTPSSDRPIRRFSRYSFRSKMPVDIEGESAQLVDLSVGGAQVLSETPLELHREAAVSLVNDEIQVSARAKVMWTRADPQSKGRALRYRAGIEFTDVDPAAVEAYIIRYSST